MNQATNGSASAELLPCPFCQSANLQTSCYGDFTRYIECKDCGASGPGQDHSADEIDYWNRRATPRAESADDAELRRLAMAAPQGQWELHDKGGQIGLRAQPFYVAWFNKNGSLPHVDEVIRATAAFVESASPATILAMIDRLEELEGAKMQLKGEMK